MKSFILRSLRKIKIVSVFSWETNVKITVRDLDGNILDVHEIHNIITTVGLNMFRDALKGAVTDLEIKYLAWGSNAGAVGVGQTTLIAEMDRKVMTTQADDGDAVLVSTVYIAPYEANDPKVEELGWFAGAAATDTVDTGIMISRILYSRDKTELESWQVERTDTISEVV